MLIRLLILMLISTQAQAAVFHVSGPRILLSDLLAGVSEDADLGPAPPPGSQRRLDRKMVLRALGGKLGKRLPRSFLVKTKAQKLTCDDLQARIGMGLKPIIRKELTVNSVSCKIALTLPFGEIAFKAHISSGAPHAGLVPVNVDIQVGDWPPVSRVYTVSIDGQVPVLVAAYDLHNNTPLGASTVEVVQDLASKLPTDALTGIDQLAGMKVIGRIAKGSVIRRGNLALIPVIHDGALVTITVTLDGIRVTSRGVARQDGSLGEIIAVLNRASSKMIKAKVVNSHQVVVEL